jgi:tRNA modification GTPase
VIAETINLQGIPATLLDTAGIVDTDDPVERIGVERSRQALQTSAAVVFILDGSVSPTPGDLAIATTLADRPRDQQTPVVIVINKQDVPDQADQTAILEQFPDAPHIRVSAAKATGLADLESLLKTTISDRRSDGAQPALINARQRAAIDRALAHIHDAQAAQDAGIPQDLLATSVRAALHAVGEVTGENVDDAVLTEIFSTFCIGK